MPDAGRVITGTAKGVVLRGPGEGTRALSDRVKQALFASLESELDDVWPVPLLDLFAGSGAVGIEALSRGAPRVVFVERSPDAARVIAENLRRARLDGGEIVRGDALRYLERGLGADAAAATATPGLAAFGVVVIDPPYADTAALEQELATALGLRVTLAPKRRGGSLTLHYASLDQLDRVLALLRRG